MFASVLACAGGGAWALGPRVTAKSLLVVGASILVLLLTGLFLGRRTLLTNAFNRRMAGFIVLATSGLVCNRVAAALAGRRPDEILRDDLLLIGVVIVAASIGMVRDLWVCAVLVGAAYGAICLWSDLATPVFIMTSVALLALGTVILERGRRDA